MNRIATLKILSQVLITPYFILRIALHIWIAEFSISIVALCNYATWSMKNEFCTTLVSRQRKNGQPLRSNFHDAAKYIHLDLAFGSGRGDVRNIVSYGTQAQDSDSQLSKLWKNESMMRK